MNKEAWPDCKNLPKASPAQVKEYFAQAKEFIKNTHFYQSIKWDVECVVAEYIAYQEGYTIRNWY